MLYKLLQKFRNLILRKIYKNPTIKINSLGPAHEYLITKCFIFVAFILFAFLAGYMVQHYVLPKKKVTAKDLKEETPELFKKMTIIIILMILNFYINKLHKFMYNTNDIVIFKSNPRGSFYSFFIGILIFLGGLLVANSYLVPEKFHLSNYIKAEDFTSKIITLSVVGINILYIMFNILHDPSWIFYYLFAILIGIGFYLNIERITLYPLYGAFTLFMVNNYMYLEKEGGIATMIHYTLYALQIALFLHGIIKEKVEFF